MLGAKISDIALNIATCSKNVFAVGKNTSPLSVTDKIRKYGVQTAEGTTWPASPQQSDGNFRD